MRSLMEIMISIVLLSVSSKACCMRIMIEKQTKDNVSQWKPLEYARKLYSKGHAGRLATEKAGFQMLEAPMDGTKSSVIKLQ